ncbi:MAG: 50S ribosomal protein L3 [Candidatus Omnitrophota bacterium]
MINGILGKKLGMTKIFQDTGAAISVTVVEAGPCPVLQVKSKERDGYTSVQLGFDIKKERNVNKPHMGRFNSVKVKPVRFIKEIRAANVKDVKASENITVDIFTVGDYVDVSGVSIGKGFQGGVKRWHWKGGPETHGSMSHRAPGSIGASSNPSRVYKGHHLPGQMGNKRVTGQNLEIMDIDKENNLLLIKGSVPGSKGSYLTIKKALKKKKKEPKKVEDVPKGKANKGKPAVKKK